MSVSVEFPPPKKVEPAKGRAGLKTHIGGGITTVSTLMEAGKATGTAGFVKKSLG